MHGTELTVRHAGVADVDLVTSLMFELLAETMGRKDPQATASRTLTRTTHEMLSEHDGVWAFIAIGRNQECVALLTLNEGTALYAGGKFGEITELYIRAGQRSSGAGQRLVSAALQFGRMRGWRRLDVAPSSVPAWQRRSLDAYSRLGFTELGAKLTLSL